MRGSKPFSPMLEAKIDSALAVVVLWSKESVRSRWVRAEAHEGLLDEKVVSVVIQVDCKLPMEFRTLNYFDLAGWDLKSKTPQLEAVVESIAELCQTEAYEMRGGLRGIDDGQLEENQRIFHEFLLADSSKSLPQLPTDLLQLAGRAFNERVTDLRSYLVKRVAKWCSPNNGDLSRLFVELRFKADKFRGLPEPDYEDLAALLEAQPDADAWMLMGEPGGGKSTALQHHELRTATEGLRAIEKREKPKELCFWVSLSSYTLADPEPNEWLKYLWKEETKNSFLGWDEACHWAQIRILADGLNEISPNDKASRAKAMGRWAKWAADLSNSSNGRLAPVFSVRTLEIGEGLRGKKLVPRPIRLAEWSDEQIDKYCQKREAGAVLSALHKPGTDKLREMCRVPFNLHAQCELHEATGRLAVDLGEQLSGIVWLRLHRELNDRPDGALRAEGLLSQDELEFAVRPDRPWKYDLRATPEDGWLLRGFDAHAESLIRSSKEGGVDPYKFSQREMLLQLAEVLRQANASPHDEAPFDLAVTEPPHPRVLLQAAKALGFIHGWSPPDEKDGSEGTFLEYRHPLWHEFFVGRNLRNRLVKNESPDNPKLIFPAPELVPFHDVWAALETNEPLPAPALSTWEEAVKIAVQLSGNPIDWIRHLSATNLALAGRAAAASLARLNSKREWSEQLVPLRAALLTRSGDVTVDLRQRIEAGQILGQLGDPRYLEGQTKEEVRFKMPTKWIRIEAGVYRIGVRGDQPDEKPVTDVGIEAFEMAFAPVTNSEYRCFVDDGGYNCEHWWGSGRELEWWKDGLRDNEEVKEWRNIFRKARDDLGGTLARVPCTASQRGWLKANAEKDNDAIERLLESRWGAHAYRLPQEWANAAFNQPSQPVVGISLFEANAYCRWLSAQSEQNIVLPTEAQWEAAARGKKGRKWPWGSAKVKPCQINGDYSHLRCTSPVGVFATADTPNGLTDMAGNVLEWTCSEYAPVLDASKLGGAATDQCDRLSVRGGSWFHLDKFSRAGFRGGQFPGHRNEFLGFRVIRKLTG